MLLDGDALGEIAGLVDIAAAANGDVVGEQLQRNHFEQRQQQFARDGDGDDVVGHFGDLFIAFAGNRDDDAAAGFDFLDIGERFFVMDLALFGLRDRAWRAPRRGDFRRSARWGRASFHRPDSLRRECRKFLSASARLRARWGSECRVRDRGSPGRLDRCLDQVFVDFGLGQDGSSLPGICASSCDQDAGLFGVRVPRTWPRYMPRIRSAVICEVKALVDATPISGPAWVSSVPAASRVIMEPTTLQMASVFEPFFWPRAARPAYRRFRPIARSRWSAYWAE